jgi:hypothetical protein
MRNPQQLGSLALGDQTVEQHRLPNDELAVVSI